MKKRRLLVSSLIMSIVFGTIAFGQNNDNQTTTLQASAVLTNDETGEIIKIPVTLIEHKATSSKTRTSETIETIETTYSAGISIPETNNGITPRDNQSNSGDDGTYSYIGTISLRYDRYYDSVKQDYALLLKNFTASWTQEDSAVTISNQIYSYACNNMGDAENQKVNDTTFPGYINANPNYRIPVYENEMTSVCGGEIHGDFRRAGTTWSGVVECYVVNQ